MYITTRASCQKKLTADSRRGRRPQSNGRYIEDREYRAKYDEQERERREELARLGYFSMRRSRPARVISIATRQPVYIERHK